ncbi:MAG: hypothetical protein HY952_06640 [Elusimicrobia bacterium]|nr:hypothetical protein [Elusimicrobiota bacterium]
MQIVNSRRLVAVVAVLFLGVASVKAERTVDFDGGNVRSNHIQPAFFSSVDIASIPQPTAVEQNSGGMILREAVLNSAARTKIAENSVIGPEEKILLLDERKVIFFDDNWILIAEGAGKERYNVLRSVDDPSLVRLLKEIALSQGRRDKGVVEVCIEVVKWVIFIKDGIEAGQWVYENVCKMEWQDDGIGEAGHIPPGTESQQRARPLLR